MKQWLWCVLVLGCGATAAAPDGSAGRNGHIGDGSIGPVDPGGVDAPTCGGEDLPLTRGLPPDLFILLDRSGSMDEAPLAGQGSKWMAVTTAIKQVVMQAAGSIKWGLAFFPTDDSCGVGDVAVPVGPSNATAIATAVDGTAPNGSTPTPTALAVALSHLTSLTDPNPKYIILATDGLPNCSAEDNCNCPPGWLDNGANECQLVGGGPYDYYTCDFPGGNSINATYWAIDDLRRRGVPTFVIGLPGDGGEQLGLNLLAQAGGEARPGAVAYYPANDQVSFQAAMSQIEMGIASCTFHLSQRPPDPDLVNVTVGGQNVPRDPNHMNGWDYGSDGLTIQLYGSACSAVQMGASDVRATFGCPPVGIHR